MKIKNVQKFLELTNYYKWFVKDFVFIARLLYDLIKELAPDLDKK